MSFHGDWSGAEYKHEAAIAVGAGAAVALPTGSLKNADGVDCQAVYITVNTAAIKFNLDGGTVAPASGTGAGHPVAAGSSFWIIGVTNVKRLRMIGDGGAATVNVSYFQG